MNAVIDEDLPRSFTAVLSALGFTSLDVRNHGLRGHSDEEIFAFAQKTKAVLFSADRGFSNILAFPPGTHHGIVVLRFPNEMSVNTINEAVKSLLENLAFTDYRGNLIILSPEKLRIRRHVL